MGRNNFAFVVGKDILAGCYSAIQHMAHEHTNARTLSPSPELGKTTEKIFHGKFLRSRHSVFSQQQSRPDETDFSSSDSADVVRWRVCVKKKISSFLVFLHFMSEHYSEVNLGGMMSEM